MSVRLTLGSPAAMRMQPTIDPPDDDDDEYRSMVASVDGIEFDVRVADHGYAVTIGSACLAGYELLDKLSSGTVDALAADALDTIQRERKRDEAAAAAAYFAEREFA